MDLGSARRIAIIGISGSGKSTLARRLATRTGLPVTYMDTVFWTGAWEAVPEGDYLRAHAAIVRRDAWIIEGFVEPSMAERLAAADLVLYLDYAGWRCGGRLLRRWIRYRRRSRPELPPEAIDRIDLGFLWLVLTRGERRHIEAAIAVHRPAALRRFASPRALERFLADA